jgi:RND family efflux transporter MFP subunit
MKKIIVIIAAIVVAAGIIFALLNNKAKIQTKINQHVEIKPTVSVATVKLQQVSQSLAMTGTILANNDVMIISETVGKVTAVKVDVGARVQAGDVLVQVDDELKLAAFRTAEVNYEKAKKDLQRYEALFKSGSITDTEIEGARLAQKAAEAQYVAARRQYTDTRITSPISGLVTSRLVDIGHMVQPGMQVANVVDINTLKINLNVAEKDVFQLQTGMAVEIRSDIYPETVFTGRIHTISAKSEEAHTYRVQVTLANSGAQPLKAGMFARVTFPLPSAASTLMIPRDALIGSRKDPQVYVIKNNVASLRTIVLGGENGLFVAVLGHLQAGEQVVVSGQSNINDGQTVNVVAEEKQP